MSSQDLSYLMDDMLESSSSSDPEPIKHSAPAAVSVTPQKEPKHNIVLENDNRDDDAVQIVVGDIVEMDAEDDGSIFEVADIVGFRFKKERLEYFCRWKGYPIADSTWEPEEEIVKLCDAELLKKWKDKAAFAAAKKSETPQRRPSLDRTSRSSKRVSFSSNKESQQTKKIKASPILKPGTPSTVNPRLTCRFCQNVYETQNILCQHIADKHAQYREFTDPDAVERIIPPLGDPEQDKVFKCRLCPFKGKEKRLVFQHKYQIHDGILPVPCDQRSCNMRFGNSEDLFAHRVEIHFPEPRASTSTSTTKPECVPKKIPADSTNEDAPAAANGRIKCPNKGCPATFKQKPSARRHILLKRCRYSANSDTQPKGPQYVSGLSSKTPQLPGSPGSPTKKVVCDNCHVVFKSQKTFEQHIKRKSCRQNSKETPSAKSPTIPSMFKQHQVKSNPINSSESDIGDSQEMPKPKTLSPKVASTSSSYVDEEMETITLRRIKGSCVMCDAFPTDLKGHILTTHVIPLDKVHRFM